MKTSIIILHFSCTDYALTMHQAISGMVEANRQWHNKQKSSLNLTIWLDFLFISYEMLV